MFTLGADQVRFKVACDWLAVWAVDAHAAHFGALSWQWARPWLEWVEEVGKPVEKEERARQYRVERDRRIEVGELAFTRAQVLRQAVAEHIEAKGWRARRWRPIPPGAAIGPGRRWGAANHQFETSLFIDTTDANGELIRRVAYWTSEKPTRQLQEWTDQWGRGPAQARDLPLEAQGMAEMLALLHTPSREALRRRDDLRTRILTVGDILRDVLRQAGAGYEPPPAHQYRAWLEQQEREKQPGRPDDAPRP